MRAYVIFDTRYGNTEKIAKSFQSGLKIGGVESVCVNVKNVPVESLKQYDLICVGGPTEAFTASKAIKEFLVKLKGIELSGKYAFAFDTKLDSRFSGSAAKFIEKELSNLNIRIVAPHDSGVVFSLKERGAITGARLKEGDEKRFEQVGLQVGAALAAGAGAAPV